MSAFPGNLPRMLGAELRAVFGRGSGKAAVAVAFTVALLTTAAMHQVQIRAPEAQVNGMPIQAMVDFSWRGLAGWSLKVRNFFVLPMLLVLATAGTVSAELRDNTLREVLVRPVPRWAILGTKLTALLILAGVTLVASLVPSLIGGAALFGTGEEITGVLLGYAASWASDLGLICLALMVSVFMRSVGGVVVLVIMTLMADLAARGLLGLLGVVGIEEAAGIADILPGAALACWEGWTEGFEAEPFIGLAAMVVVCISVALARFQRMDVP